MVLFRQHKLKEAIECFDKATKLNPKLGLRFDMIGIYKIKDIS